MIWDSYLGQRWRGFVGFMALAVLLALVSSQLRPQTELKVRSLPASLLLQVRDDELFAVHSFAIYEDSKNWQLLPEKLFLDTGTSQTTLAESATGLNLNNSRNWLQSNYGLAFTEVWVVDRVALSAFVDLVGGVEVKPDSDLMLRLNSKPIFYLSKNQSVRLDGIAASVYATSSKAKPKRFIQVWRQVMEKLDAAYLETVLPSIGNSSRSSMALPNLINWIEINQAFWVNSQVQWAATESDFELLDNRYRLILPQSEIVRLRKLGKSSGNS